MLSFPRKKKIEGWSISDVQDGRLSRLMTGIRNSNRAWVVCFIGIVLVASIMFHATGTRDSLAPVKTPAPAHIESGPYQDEAHDKFLQDYHRDMRKRGIDVQLSFADAGLLDLVLSEGTNKDDVRFAGKMAAVGVYNRFHNAPIVTIYIHDNSVPPKLKLLATCQWERNGFSVKFVGSGAQESEESEESPL